jgi:hypothetical protein
LDEGFEYARNLKFILCLFEQMSGLKINFAKSEVFCFGKCKDMQESYEEIFTCKSGALPLKYLGVPIDKKKLLNIHWKPAEDKMEKKLGCWQGKMLDMGVRVLLINACLSSIPLYMLSFYRLPVGAHKRFNIYRSRFLWQEEQGVRKYHLVDWETVCTPKDLGGLGILNQDMMNIGLLCKWLWKLENESGMWQDILKKKYLQKETMSQIEEKPGVSQLWSGLVKVKEIFYKFCKRIVVSGNKTRF